MRSRLTWLSASIVTGTLLWACVAQAAPADDAYAVAAGHYARRRWDLAAESFDRYLREFPQHSKRADALFYQGEAYLQAGDNEHARQRFLEYLEAHPAHAYRRQATFRAAETAYLLGLSEAARTELERFLDQFPDDPLNAYTLTYLGELAEEANDFERAAAYFGTALERFPEGRSAGQCRLGLAHARSKQGRFDEAIQLVTPLAEGDGHLADDAVLELGATAYAQGDFVTAIGEFQRLLTRFPQSDLCDQSKLNCGWAHYRLGKLSEAESQFRSLVDRPEVAQQARYWLGLSCVAQDAWQRAADALLPLSDALLEQAAAPDEAASPQSPFSLSPEERSAVHYHAAEAQRRVGAQQPAAERFARLRAIDPQGLWADDALIGQLATASALGQHEEVDRLSGEFAHQFADSDLATRANILTARSLLARKQYAAARERLEPLHAANGDAASRTEIQYLLALAYEGAGQSAEALPLAEAVVAAQHPLLSAEAQLICAAAHLASEDFARALVALEGYLQASPDGAAAARSRAQRILCLAHTDQWDTCREAWNEFATRHAQEPLFLPTARHLADLAQTAQQTEWALTLFDLLASPENPAEYRKKGLLGKGWTLYRQSSWEAAAAEFGRLIEAFPSDPEATQAALARAQILARSQQNDAALAAYRQLIDATAEPAARHQALLAAARLHDRLQQDREAEPLYRKLAQEAPDLSERDAVLYEWAWVLRDLGQAAEAADRFRELRAAFPASRYWSDATYRLAEAALERGELEQTTAWIAELQARGDLGPLREHVLYLAARTAIVQEDWSAAHEPLATLIEEFPTGELRLPAEYWLAEAAYRRQDYATAATHFAAVSRQAQGRTESWVAMTALRQAQLRALEQDWTTAKELASRVAQEFPDFAQAYEADYVIGRSLAALAEFEAAREAYRRVIHSERGQKTETAARAQLMVGESYFHQRNFETALREYLTVEILYDYPELQAAGLLQAGKCYERLDRWADAAKLYERLSAEFANTSHAREAQERLSAARERAVSPRSEG